MIAFTVLGFIAEGGRYLDFNLDIFADSPADAMEMVLRRHANLVVSSVHRSSRGGLPGY